MATKPIPTGARFGRLTFVERCASLKGESRGLFRCDCGQSKEINLASVRSGRSKSCGCGHLDGFRSRRRNLEGQRFGRLVAISAFDPGQFARTMWRCRCDCGNPTIVQTQNLLSGHTTSCGCAKVEHTPANKTHGRSMERGKYLTYRSWQSMIARCENPRTTRFECWGGRGIKVCDRWRHSFRSFVEDMGERPRGLALDRDNNDGDYEPGNCRWATPKEQAANRRRRGKK